MLTTFDDNGVSINPFGVRSRMSTCISTCWLSSLCYNYRPVTSYWQVDGETRCSQHF